MATANAIEDGVGEGGFVDDSMPRLNRKLTGDDGGAPAIAVLDDLHQVAALGRGEPVGSPVIEDEQIGAHQFPEQPLEAPVASGEFEVGKEAWQTVVEDGAPRADGGVAQGPP